MTTLIEVGTIFRMGVELVLGQNGSRQNGTEKMVYGQNGIGQNGMDKMARTEWYG